MVPPDPEASPPGGALPLPQENGPQQEVSGPDSPANAFGRLLALALAAALIAGAVSVLAGERILGHYGDALLPPPSIHPNPEEARLWKEARLHSAVLNFTTLAGLLGLSMGLAGGLARRAAGASLRAAIAGLLLGIAVVAPIALILVSNFFARHDPQSVDLMLPLLTHGAIWSAAGAIGGLAFGLGIGGRGRWKATLAGGLFGAAAATMIYEIVGALAFATSRTELPLSSSIATRGMAQFLVTTLSAMGVVLALNQPARRITSRSSAA
jgi:hypothetical protein